MQKRKLESLQAKEATLKAKSPNKKYFNSKEGTRESAAGFDHRLGTYRSLTNNRKASA